MIHGVHHINIHTPDLDRLWAFYKEAFGFELVFEHYLEDFPVFVKNATGVDGAAARVVTLRADNLFVELKQWSAPKGQDLQPLRPYDFGYTHVAIAVDDIESTYKRLVELGMKFVYPSPLQVEVNGGIYGSVYGHDPDGNIIELTKIPAGDNMSLGALQLRMLASGAGRLACSHRGLDSSPRQSLRPREARVSAYRDVVGKQPSPALSAAAGPVRIPVELGDSRLASEPQANEGRAWHRALGWTIGRATGPVSKAPPRVALVRFAPIPGSVEDPAGALGPLTAAVNTLTPPAERRT